MMANKLLILPALLIELSMAVLPCIAQAENVHDSSETTIGSSDSLPNYLKALHSAKTLDNGAVGIVGIRSEIYNAFTQALAAGKDIRPALEEMLQRASPAGRIYAAILIRQFDPVAGRKALERLQSDSTIVAYHTGCIIDDEHTVGSIATELLQGQIYVAIPD